MEKGVEGRGTGGWRLWSKKILQAHSSMQQQQQHAAATESAAAAAAAAAGAQREV